MHIYVHIYIYIYIEQDENSMISWSTSFYYNNHNTNKIFGDPVAILSDTMYASIYIYMYI